MTPSVLPPRKSSAAIDVDEAMRRLIEAFPGWDAPVITFMAQVEQNPFKLLIATLISLRTKDEVTGPASARLFARAADARTLAELPQEEIEKLIYPAGFYRNKARNIREVCRLLLERFDGRVPDDIDVLLTLPGVGRKTANLVVAEGYGKPGICVDTHVHRISNRWAYVRTATPEETETALRRKLPPPYWAPFNSHLVAFGQTICKPISPLCSTCLLANICPRRGVKQHR
jgi:endonuclease III